MNTTSISSPLPDSHRWKILAIGVAANASFSAVIGGISATGVLLRSAYHLNTASLGIVLGMLGLGVAISELPWGMLTDRVGDRPVLLTGLISTAGMLAGMSALMSARVLAHFGVLPFWPLVASLLAVGLLGSSVNGSSGRAIMTWFATRERGLAMSIRQTAVPLGFGLGALVMPVTAAHFGFAAVFAICALVCIVSAVFAWRWLHEPPTATSVATAQGASQSAEQTQGRRSPISDPQIWRMVLAIGILCAPQFAVLTFGAIFLHDIYGLSPAAAGAVLAVVQAGAMIMRVWSGRWTDRHQNRRSYLQTCCLIAGIAFVVLGVLSAAGFAHQSAAIAPVIVVVVISGIGVSAWHGVAYAELAEMAGVSRAGTALAMGNMAAFALLFITPSSIPLLLRFHSWTAVWIAAVLCTACARTLFPRDARTGTPRAAQRRIYPAPTE